MPPTLNRVTSLWGVLVKTFRLWRKGAFPYKSAEFSVAPKSAWELVYSEGERQVVIETGIGCGEKLWDTWTTIDMTKKLQWLPPYERENIPLEKKNEIITNLQKAFEALETPYEIHFPE